MKRLITSGTSFSSEIYPNEKTTLRWFWCFLVAAWWNRTRAEDAGL